MEIKEMYQQMKQKFDTDPAFAASLKESKTLDDVLCKLRAAGFDVTEADLKAMSKAYGREMSDDELDNVAGGWWIFW